MTLRVGVEEGMISPMLDGVADTAIGAGWDDMVWHVKRSEERFLLCLLVIGGMCCERLRVVLGGLWAGFPSQLSQTGHEGRL